MRFALLKRLNGLRRERRACVVATDPRTGEQWLYTHQDLPKDASLRTEIEGRFYSGKSGSYEHLFLATYLPDPRLVIIGAVHISQHMVKPAIAAGFDVSVIDPRTAFASEERFDGVPLYADWPDEILKDKPLDDYTALAALTHDPKIDDAPLLMALHKNCFYAGALGSRKTHEKRIVRLKEQGASESEVSKIKAPIGLDIGAATPAEIAIAILAEIIAARRGKV